MKAYVPQSRSQCLGKGVIERPRALIAEPFPGPGPLGRRPHRRVGPRTVITANELHNRLGR